MHKDDTLSIISKFIYKAVSMKIIFDLEPSLQIARNMQKKAFCPYSNFAVGAAVQTKDHQIIGGCNIESASYGLTICAERVAIFSALAQGHTDFNHVVLVTNTASYPCGACRQILYEFCPDAQITITTPNKIINTVTVKSLMPYVFCQADLNKKKE
jgi:cytidine deaminase